MKNSKGFTMVEMIIVIAIIAVLAMFIIPKISDYITVNKETYDGELINQLAVSGKNYYSENKDELPKKPYNRTAIIANSHVALPTLQSGNYVSKDFVDSEGRNCSESYVYVRQPSGSTENEFHPCLICRGDDGLVVNHTQDNPYCNTANWNDNTNPNCSMSAEVEVDGNSKVVDGANGSKTFYNPSKLIIQANEKIVYIIIRGYENETNKEIIHEELDVSKMPDQEIYGMNLINYFPKKNGKIVTARYEITVVDQGNNESRCLMDPNNGDPDITIIMDEEAPTCTIKDYQEVANNKYIKFTEVKDNWSKQENISVLINKAEVATRAQMNNSNRHPAYQYSLAKATDGTYYGHVMDEAGNIGNCQKPVTIDMLIGEVPYCKFTKDAPDTWLKKGGVANLAVECYVDQSLITSYDSSKLVSDNKLGTPVISGTKNPKGGNPDRTEYKIKYTATTEKKSGKDYVSLQSGFFKTTDNQVNEALKSKEIKVDAIPPTIKFSPSKTKENEKKGEDWYKVSEKSPLVITISCADANSGVKEFIVNSKIIKGTSSSITFKKANNPYTITSKCTDVAGNPYEPSPLKVYTKIYSEHSSCGIDTYVKCQHKDCKCKTYVSCPTKSCGCALRKRCDKAPCASYKTEYTYKWSGVKTTKWGEGKPSNRTTSNNCTSSNYNKNKITDEKCLYYEKNGLECLAWSYEYKTCTRKPKQVCDYYERSPLCDCESYISCPNSVCGCKTHYSCRTAGCGVEKYKECWHY